MAKTFGELLMYAVSPGSLQFPLFCRTSCEDLYSLLREEPIHTVPLGNIMMLKKCVVGLLGDVERAASAIRMTAWQPTKLSQCEKADSKLDDLCLESNRKSVGNLRFICISQKKVQEVI